MISEKSIKDHAQLERIVSDSTDEKFDSIVSIIIFRLVSEQLGSECEQIVPEVSKSSEQ